VVKKLNDVVGDAPIRSCIDHACSHTCLRHKNTNDLMVKLSNEINSLELYVKTKDFTLIYAHNRISYMSKFLNFAKDITDYPKEASKKQDDIKQVEEIKILNDIPNDRPLNLSKWSLHELLTMLQKYASYSSTNMCQTGFGSCIIDLVFKEKINRYKNRAMIPSKIGDIWEPKIHVTIGKIKCTTMPISDLV
jgi:hypothetical protein